MEDNRLERKIGANPDVSTNVKVLVYVHFLNNTFLHNDHVHVCYYYYSDAIALLGGDKRRSLFCI